MTANEGHNSGPHRGHHTEKGSLRAEEGHGVVEERASIHKQPRARRMKE